MVKIKQFLGNGKYFEDDSIDSLKPCPFCGKVDMISITSKACFSENYLEHGSATISLNCQRCDLDIYETSYSGTKYETKARILVQKWNERSENNESEEG